MQIPSFSNGQITPQKAVQIQKDLREKVILTNLKHPLFTIGGADISFNKGSNTIYAGIVILKIPSLTIKCTSLVITQTNFPYIPGLLAFREVPALWEAWTQLPEKPDLLMLDGHGIAHPRRMGLACHFGVLTNHPTMGCAKKILTGKFESPEMEKGSYSRILEGKEMLGYAYRTKTGVKPVFISPGHLIGFEDLPKIMELCDNGYKNPEPTRQAHIIVNKLRKEKLKPGANILG